MPIGNGLSVIRKFKPFAPVITSDGVIVGTYNQSNFSYFITATNSPTLYGIETPSTLPAGLKLNTITGQITGTPTTVDSTGKVVIISASNQGGKGTKNLLIKILPLLPVITSSLSTIHLIKGVLVNPFYTIKATHMTTLESPIGYFASNLPNGLSQNTTTGVLSGTPTTLSSTDITINATNATGTGSASLTIIIDPPAPVFGAATTDIIGVGESFTYKMIANNNPTSYNVGNVPNWITFDGIDTISGTAPTSIKTISSFNVPMSATNSTGTGTSTHIVKVIAAPVITSPLTANLNLNNKYTTAYIIVATNMGANAVPVNYTATGLPASLTVDSTNGTIAGTPTVAGTTNVTIGAANVKLADTKTLVIKVLPPPPVFTSSTGQTITVGTLISWAFTASNNPTSYNVGTLPNWLSFDGTQTITGTSPNNLTISTNYIIALSATNSGGTGTQNYLIRVVAIPVITNLPSGAVHKGGTAVTTFNIVANNMLNTDAPTKYIYKAISAPAGVTQNTDSHGNTTWDGITVESFNILGRVDIVQDIVGSYTIEVTALNKAGSSATKLLSIFIT